MSPPFATEWNDTSQAVRRHMPDKRTTAYQTPFVDYVLNVPITTTQNILAVQYVSAPVKSDAVFMSSNDYIIRCSESDLGINAVLVAQMRMIAADFSLRGSYIGAAVNQIHVYAADAVEFTLDGAAATRRKASGATYTVTPLAGSRMVFEVGVNVAAPTVSGTATLRFGNGAATDFAATTGLTTDLNPYYNVNIDVFSPYQKFENYQSIKAGDGISVGERVR